MLDQEELPPWSERQDCCGEASFGAIEREHVVSCGEQCPHRARYHVPGLAISLGSPDCRKRLDLLRSEQIYLVASRAQAVTEAQDDIARSLMRFERTVTDR